MRNKQSSAAYVGGLLALFNGTIAVQVSLAAPLTFRFDATVTTFFTAQFDPGFDVALGDHIHGRFTFEPAASDTPYRIRTRQNLPFVVNVNGAVVDTTSYVLEAQAHAMPNDVENVTDMLFFVGGNGTPVAVVPDGEPITWSFFIDLWAGGNVLDVAEYPSDPAIWNEFQRHSALVVSIFDMYGDALSFQATVGSFEQVPEPRAAVLAAVILMLFISRHLVAREKVPMAHAHYAGVTS